MILCVHCGSKRTVIMMTVEACLSREFRVVYRCLDCWRLTVDIGWISYKKGCDISKQQQDRGESNENL